MATRRAVGVAAGLGQHGGDAHRGRGRAVAGPRGRFHRADRVGAGQLAGGAGQRDGRVAVLRLAHLVADRRAQIGVAWSFWLTAPYIAAESVHHLLYEHHAETSVIGIALTAASLVLMPILGRAKHLLADRLGSSATASEGTQNYLCGAQAAAVLVGLAFVGIWPACWWFDPVVGLGIAAASIWQGIKSWRGEDCGC